MSFLIRCSSLGQLMTEPRSKADKEAGKLSQTAISHLIDVFTRNEYKREQDIQTKYTKKGLQVEESSITLLSRIKRKMFVKNDHRFTDEILGLTGEPDIIVKKKDTVEIIDIKSSWDIFTFNRTKYSNILLKEINPIYYWQLQAYMLLTGSDISKLCYCLIDTPTALIFDECNRLKWKMGVLKEDTDETYLEACEEIERKLTYDDIPDNERLYEITIPRNEEDIERIKAKLLKCREFYENTFLKQTINSN